LVRELIARRMAQQVGQLVARRMSEHRLDWAVGIRFGGIPGARSSSLAGS
jgi:hypothetical protein